jgi:hypothetical protein
MAKSFFGEKYVWTTEANACDNEVHYALKTIFASWIKKGYSPREIAHIVSGTAISLECEAVMDIRADREPFKR